MQQTQRVVWLAPLGGDKEHGTRRLSGLPTRPKRLWTLFPHMVREVEPTLPYAPQHNVNAFLEDFRHDWDWSGDTLRYYSRVVGAQDGVWLLLEL